MPKAFSKEFKEDVVRVARHRGPEMLIKRVQKHIGDEPFFCTYGDGLANATYALSSIFMPSMVGSRQ